MQFQLESGREDNGRWLAESAAMPGVLAYGASANEAMAKAEVLALRVLAEQLQLQLQLLPGQARPSQAVSASPRQRLHESVAFGHGEARFQCVACPGWQLKHQSGSHRTLAREGWPNFVFAFHDGKELGSCSKNTARVWLDEDHLGRSIRLADRQSESERDARISDVQQTGDAAHRSQSSGRSPTAP